MLSKHTLQMQPRDKVGSRYASRARAAGLLPAVVYGHKENPVAVALDHKTTVRFFHDGERIFKASIDGGSETTVMLKDLQYDHLGTGIIHADFERVDLDETVTTTTHIKFLGEAPGEKKAGAVFVHPMEVMHIRCKVKDLPEHVEVDISKLEAGEVITVGDLDLPAGIESLDPDDRRVCAVTWTNAEAASSEEGEDSEGEAGEPEAIRQKGDEEGGDADSDENKED